MSRSRTPGSWAMHSRTWAWLIRKVQALVAPSTHGLPFGQSIARYLFLVYSPVNEPGCSTQGRALIAGARTETGDGHDRKPSCWMAWGSHRAPRGAVLRGPRF